MLEASVKQTQDTVARLQEELTTTTSNYELQLSSLSEHMANMNDKLAAQQEEIEVLNYQLAEKVLAPIHIFKTLTYYYFHIFSGHKERKVEIDERIC